MMGALTVMNGAEGEMFQRARTLVRIGAVAGIVLFAIGGFWVHAMHGFHMAGNPGAGVPQTPLEQTVDVAAGAWFANFSAHPVLWLVPVIGFAWACLARCSPRKAGVRTWAGGSAHWPGSA